MEAEDYKPQNRDLDRASLVIEDDMTLSEVRHEIRRANHFILVEKDQHELYGESFPGEHEETMNSLLSKKEALREKLRALGRTPENELYLPE